MLQANQEKRYKVHATFGRRKAPRVPCIKCAFLRRIAAFLAFALLQTGAATAANLPAFPGAEGGGALAIGGRGGYVCRVTNLNDSGPGSFRACVDRNGPRTIIFDVGGTIKLKSRITIRNPYITIAGQTAPGGGIQIKADKENLVDGRGDIAITTHDVVIRYLRLRRGRTNDKSSNIRVTGGENIILDHLSLYWAENENFTVWSWSASHAPQNVTLQNSILAEMLDRVNVAVGAETASAAEATKNIDFHNNLFANTKHRNPLLQNGETRFVNNIVYQWTSWASRTVGGVRADWIGNLYRPGPTPPGSRGQQEIMAVAWSEAGTSLEKKINAAPSLFVGGNRGHQSGMDPRTDNWPYTREAGPKDNSGPIGPIPIDWRRAAPLPATPIPISVIHVDELENRLLPIVGASRRLDCSGNWLLNRDSTDERVINEYRNKGGMLISHESEVGGHPVLASDAPCKDSSGDGVPDAWAIANGLDHNDSSLGRRTHESGYTYLELYLSGIQLGRKPPASPQAVVVE